MNIETQKRFLIRIGFWAVVILLVILCLKYVLPFLLPFVVSVSHSCSSEQAYYVTGGKAEWGSG